MTTLVVDVGESMVGIYSVEDREYIGYRGSRISEALERIQNADEVITYCGEIYDLTQLGKFAGIDGELPLKGKHIDVNRMVWDPLPRGSSLEGTFKRHFESCSEFPFGRRGSPDCDDYEADNQRDVYMTFKLWELWRDEKLDIVGYGYTYH